RASSCAACPRRPRAAWTAAGPLRRPSRASPLLPWIAGTMPAGPENTPNSMQVYLVGGAVRDKLLGLEVADRDHVVVGATPDDLLAQGYRPVGKDFPVFLHPDSAEEYALARTERKTGRGYHGFA